MDCKEDRIEKNKPHLVTFHGSILVSLRTFQSTILSKELLLKIETLLRIQSLKGINNFLYLFNNFKQCYDGIHKQFVI